MTKKLFFILNIIMIAMITCGGVWYVTYGAIWRKSIASAMFFLLGFLNLIYAMIVRSKEMKFTTMMVTGLLVCVAADIVLQIEFLYGAILFAAGHICYFISYGFLAKLRRSDFIIGASIFVPAVIFLLTPLFDYGSIVMEVMCVIYAVIISCMVGKAVSNLIHEKNPRNITIVLGCVLFFFSDLMLVLNVFAHLPRIIDTLCVVSYYPAQALLAHSIFLSAGKKNR